MKITLESEVIPQFAAGATSFTPFGLFLNIPGGQKLVPWSQVREIESDSGEVYQLLTEAGVK